MPNLTLSADQEVIDRARLAAQKQGKSLNDMVRAYLRSLAGMDADDHPAEELLSLMREHGGHSSGQSWRRDDFYAEQLKLY